MLRLEDVKRTCEMLGIELLEGDYELEKFLDKAKGKELLGEKSERCFECFDLRLEASALKAFELGEKKFTTTLLTSPKKTLTSSSLRGRASRKGTIWNLSCLETIILNILRASWI